MGGEGEGSGKYIILVGVACFGINVGVAKNKKTRIEEWRIRVWKQRSIPYDVGAMIRVGDFGCGPSNGEKEDQREWKSQNA